ncbi:Protein of unknown function [Devosia limi DSM 17137]|nr:Protein of unknown function [Devosia limi DSM 17137]
MRDNLGAGRDDFYSALMQAHEGLSEAQSHQLNVRLVLLMANEIGDLKRLRAVIELAGRCER